MSYQRYSSFAKDKSKAFQPQNYYICVRVKEFFFFVLLICYCLIVILTNNYLIIGSLLLLNIIIPWPLNEGWDPRKGRNLRTEVTSYG